MTRVRLTCALVGGGRAFPVSIDASYLVEDLKVAIKSRYSVTITCDAVDLQLFMAKTGDGKWLGNADVGVPEVDPKIQAMLNAGELTSDQSIDKALGLTFLRPPKAKHIHVLVRQTWDVDSLSTIHPQVQQTVWQSVVKNSSEFLSSATALVVDRTETHVHLLTNLHVWADDLLLEDASNDFKNQIERFLSLYPDMGRSGGKRKSVGAVTGQLTRKSPWTTKKTSHVTDLVEVLVEQFDLTNKVLKNVLRFRIHHGVCWRSSAEHDFAVFEVAVGRQDILHVPCEFAAELPTVNTMSVHVFGFPGALEDEKSLGHCYTIIPTHVTGWSKSEMMLSALSAPGLSGGAIVCTKRGQLVGYVGGAFDSSKKHDQFQSYGHTFVGFRDSISGDEEEKRE